MDVGCGVVVQLFQIYFDVGFLMHGLTGRLVQRVGLLLTVLFFSC